MEFDTDLRSIQEVRNLVQEAQTAQQIFKNFSQEQVDSICAAMARAGRAEASRLAALAVSETNFGKVPDKELKNILATEIVFNFIKDMKTVGVIKRDHKNKIFEIAEPMGIVAGIIPSTNPTSTALYKILIAVKSRNAIILSPHPLSTQCTREAVKIMCEAALAAGAPAGLIGCMSSSTRQGTEELMTHPHVAVILATGGSGLVKAAYSSGKPAFGVGPGNVPVFIERTADIERAVADVLVSKAFDNGTVCASEQAIVADAPIFDRVVSSLKANGAYFLSAEEQDQLGKTLVAENGTINPGLVGKSAVYIAQHCSFAVPLNTTVLIAQPAGVGPQHPLSREKLCPVLALYKEDGWKRACDRCIEIIRFGGTGHTMGIHSRDDEIIMEFALQKPVFRIIANSPTTHGAVGFSTGLAPALTLGCGTWGGNATSDNVTPLHLINIKRLAHGLRSVHSTGTSLEKENPAVQQEDESSPLQDSAAHDKRAENVIQDSFSEKDIRDIIVRVLGKVHRKT